MPDKEEFNFEIDPSLGGMEGFGLFDGNIPMPEPGEDGAPWGGEDVLFPDATPRNQYEPLDPEKMPQIDAVKQDTPEYAARPAEERTHELLAYMRPHRASLLGMLRAAVEPVSNTQMTDVAEALRKRKFSVYSAANLCTMLETAGALERVTANGTPYAQMKPEPDIVVVDGEEYYQPVPAPEVHWVATDAGQGLLDEDDPIGRLEVQFERDEGLLPIYKQVLHIARDGASMATFSAKVDANPDIANPRRFFVQHFVESLERCDAMAWDGEQWVITDIGEQVLETMLADVEAAPEFEPSERSAPTDGAVVPTETQGVNW